MMQLCLETNCNIWNDGISLYRFVYYIFPYSLPEEIYLRNCFKKPFTVTTGVEKECHLIY